MITEPKPTAKGNLIEAGTLLFRKQGYVTTTVDQICFKANVTKGAFFHHFKSKEKLGEACLQQWDRFGAMLDEQAREKVADSLGTDADPVGIVLGFMEAIISIFDDPKLLKSCLAGTVVQEVFDTHSPLRAVANRCFENAELRLKDLLDDAFQAQGVEANTASLASLWIATMQGSLTLAKASTDESVIGKNLEHIKLYVANLLRANASAEPSLHARSKRKRR